MEQKRRMNAEQKMMILRELLENRQPIGELSEKYGIHPNVIYNWKKILFEQGKQLFEQKPERGSAKAEQKLALVEAKLRVRESLITEIVEDNIRLKKKMNGES